MFALASSDSYACKGSVCEFPMPLVCSYLLLAFFGLEPEREL